MVIPGLWLEGEDRTMRPMVRVELARTDQSRIADFFLVDSGADRTVFSAALGALLQLPIREPDDGLSLTGIGGRASSGIVATQLEFRRENGALVRVRGDFAVFLDPMASDLSILGRDVLDNFDVIVSRRRHEVLLVAGRHRYSIEVES